MLAAGLQRGRRRI